MLQQTLRFVTNLNCGRCIAAVKPYLDQIPGIHHWTVDTTTPAKLLTVEGTTILPETVKAAVAQGGFRVIGEQPAPTVEPPTLADSPSPVTYFPLLLLVTFIVLVIGLVEWRTGSFAVSRAMQNFMGAFFVTFSFFKLLDLRGFADSYRMYNVIATRIPVYGYVYPFIELLLGAAYIGDFLPWTTNLVTFVVMSVSSIGVLQSVLNRRKIRCACLGTIFNLPMSTVTLVEDGLMIGMAAVALLGFGHQEPRRCSLGINI